MHGRSDEAVRRLADAEAGFAAAGMGLFAAVCRRARGRLAGGPDGRTLVAEGEAWMAGQGIRNAERMAALLLPGRFGG